MTKTRHIAAEYERRKKALAADGYKVEEHALENLLIVEMFVEDKDTGATLVREQEGVAVQGLTEFLFECRKLSALERLSTVVTQMWAEHNASPDRKCV
jgi:hypothetical protein